MLLKNSVKGTFIRRYYNVLLRKVTHNMKMIRIIKFEALGPCFEFKWQKICLDQSRTLKFYTLTQFFIMNNFP